MLHKLKDKHRHRQGRKAQAVKPKRAPEPPKALTVTQRAEEELARIHQAFHAGPVFRDPIPEKGTADSVCAWSILNTFEKVIQVRKGKFREHLLDNLKSEGSQTDKGGNRLYVDHNEVVRERRQEKKPNEEDLKIMLRSKGLSITECFDEVKTYVFNASKLDFLVQSGKLDQKEVDALKKESFALKVKPSDALNEALDNFANDILGNPRGTKWLPKKTGEED